MLFSSKNITTYVLTLGIVLIASYFADNIILTNDNPRFENPEKIRRDIKRGIKKKKKS